MNVAGIRRFSFVIFASLVSNSLYTAEVVVRFVPAVYNVSESVGFAGVRFVKEGEAETSVTVMFTTEGRQAVSGEHFVSQSDNVTFAPSDVEKFAAVEVIEDGVYDGTKNFLGVLTPVSPGVRIEGGPAIINILDNDGRTIRPGKKS